MTRQKDVRQALERDIFDLRNTIHGQEDSIKTFKKQTEETRKM